jgi:hypothetical protein
MLVWIVRFYHLKLHQPLLKTKMAPTSLAIVDQHACQSLAEAANCRERENKCGGLICKIFVDIPMFICRHLTWCL